MVVEHNISIISIVKFFNLIHDVALEHKANTTKNLNSFGYAYEVNGNHIKLSRKNHAGRKVRPSIFATYP